MLFVCVYVCACVCVCVGGWVGVPDVIYFITLPVNNLNPGVSTKKNGTQRSIELNLNIVIINKNYGNSNTHLCVYNLFSVTINNIGLTLELPTESAQTMKVNTVEAGTTDWFSE